MYVSHMFIILVFSIIILIAVVVVAVLVVVVVVVVVVVDLFYFSIKNKTNHYWENGLFSLCIHRNLDAKGHWDDEEAFTECLK